MNFVHPFEHKHVIAGQGSIAAEIMDVCPDTVVVPIGGGGLISGIGMYLKSKGVRIIGAQVENVDAMSRRLEGTELLTEVPMTVADGTRVVKAGVNTEKICRRVVDETIRVTEEEVRQTIAELAVHEKVVVEGAGAIAVAALKKVRGERKVAVVSGGNIDPAVLAKILTEKS